MGYSSVVNAGSTFWFKLPLHKPPQPNGLTEPIDPSTSHRALLIDDNNNLYNALNPWFEQWGISANIVCDTRDLIKALGESKDANPYSTALIDSRSYLPNQAFLDNAFDKEPALKDAKIALLHQQSLEKLSIGEDVFDFRLSKPISIKNLKALLSGGKDDPQILPMNDASNWETIDASSKAILVIDDNSTNRLIACQSLEKRHKVKPDTARDGLEAIEAMKSREYDLVFMDCMMPNMDGYEATRCIREGYCGNSNDTVPIVALTANARPEDRVKCIESGMTDHLAKPIRPKELADTLAKWMGGRHADKEESSISEPQTSDPSALFDPNQIIELVGDDRELLSSIASEFISSTNDIVAALSETLDDWEALKTLADSTRKEIVGFSP